MNARKIPAIEVHTHTHRVLCPYLGHPGLGRHVGEVTVCTPQPNQAARTFCRRVAGATWACPVELVPGDKVPTLKGESHHYETMGGSRIYHPSAYSKRGWSNMRYVHSTLRVEVGFEWLQGACRRAALAPRPFLVAPRPFLVEWLKSRAA